MKKLIIIAEDFDLQIGTYVGQSDIEVLALSATAMLSLERQGIEYRTVDSFYSVEQYRADVRQLIEETVEVFAECDSAVNDQIGILFSYSGNLAYFLSLFSDFLYLEGLTREIKKKFPTSTLLVGKRVPELRKWDDLKFNQLKGAPTPMGGLSMPLTRGIHTKVALLKIGLDSECVEVENQLVKAVSIARRLRALVSGVLFQVKKRLQNPGILVKWFFTRLRVLLLNFCRGGALPRSLVIQNGYELTVLWQFLGSRRVMFWPILQLRRRIPSFECRPPDYQEVSELLAGFLQKMIPTFSEQISGLFESYHREIVGRLPVVSAEFSKILARVQPDHLLFSIGDRDVLDTLFGVEGNKRNIPVIFFQHGGVASQFVINPYKRFIEHSELVDHHLILATKAEHRYFLEKKILPGITTPLGSVSQFQTVCARKSGRKRRALYLTSPFSSHTFRNFVVESSDRDRLKINQSIFDATRQVDVSLDVKLHPIEQETHLDYFLRLKQARKSHNVNLICGGHGEAILGRYDLVLLDYLPSTLVPFVMRMDVPIICWPSPLAAINPWFISDLKRRCYFVTGKDQLISRLENYKAGTLVSKWTAEFSEQYGGWTGKMPGDKIAEFLESVA